MWATPSLTAQGRLSDRILDDTTRRPPCRPRLDWPSHRRALLVTAESDMLPAIAVVRQADLEKQTRVLTPPGQVRSAGLIGQAAGGAHPQITELHVRRCLLPASISIPGGQPVIRPPEYAPPGPA